MRIIKQASYNIDTTGHLRLGVSSSSSSSFFLDENERFWLLRMNNFVKDVGFILISSGSRGPIVIKKP